MKKTAAKSYKVVHLNPNLKDATIEYGSELQWHEIPIGRAFYFTGCGGIGIKISEANFLSLNWINTVGNSRKVSWKAYDEIIFLIWKGYTGLFTFYALPTNIRRQLEAL